MASGSGVISLYTLELAISAHPLEMSLARDIISATSGRGSAAWVLTTCVKPSVVSAKQRKNLEDKTITMPEWLQENERNCFRHLYSGRWLGEERESVYFCVHFTSFLIHFP